MFFLLSYQRWVLVFKIKLYICLLNGECNWLCKSSWSHKYTAESHNLSFLINSLSAMSEVYICRNTILLLSVEILKIMAVSVWSILFQNCLRTYNSLQTLMKIHVHAHNATSQYFWTSSLVVGQMNNKLLSLTVQARCALNSLTQKIKQLYILNELICSQTLFSLF